MKNMRKDSPKKNNKIIKIGVPKMMVRKVSSEREKKIEEALGLQMISIRLQKDLIDDLKILATEAGIGYQPYIRQLLTQHIRSKRKRDGTYG